MLTSKVDSGFDTWTTVISGYLGQDARFRTKRSICGVSGTEVQDSELPVLQSV